MPQPSPITKPLALASNGHERSADKAPILENLTNDCGLREESTPPVSTMSYRPSCRPAMAACRAAKDDAQAASVVKFGPLKLKTWATRPAMTLESSPGMVSSVMGGRWPNADFLN